MRFDDRCFLKGPDPARSIPLGTVADQGPGTSCRTGVGWLIPRFPVLARAHDLAEAQYKTMANIVQEARIATQDSANIVQIASEATAPTERASPRRTLNTLLGGAVGLMLGVFAAFVGEWWRAPQPSLAESTDPALRRVFAVKPDGAAAPSHTGGKKEAEQAEPVGSQLVQQGP